MFIRDKLGIKFYTEKVSFIYSAFICIVILWKPYAVENFSFCRIWFNCNNNSSRRDGKVYNLVIFFSRTMKRFQLNRIKIKKNNVHVVLCQPQRFYSPEKHKRKFVNTFLASTYNYFFFLVFYLFIVLVSNKRLNRIVPWIKE